MADLQKQLVSAMNADRDREENGNTENVILAIEWNQCMPPGVMADDNVVIPWVNTDSEVESVRRAA